MISTSPKTFERGALIKLINDIEAALKASEQRMDPHSLYARPVLEIALEQRKKELVAMDHKPRRRVEDQPRRGMCDHQDAGA